MVGQEVVKNLDRFDEGLLQTLNSWVLKVQDDEQNKPMVSQRKQGQDAEAGTFEIRA